MEPNFTPELKLPTFLNTRNDLEGVVSERVKLETELCELEMHMHNFEEAILRRGGPYFGRIAQGERAGQIIEDVTKTAKEAASSGGIVNTDESSSDCGNNSRKIRESERLFSNSSVTSPTNMNKKVDQPKVKVEPFCRIP